MHRVGLASVQLTRSTAAEATACRECLQPSALRARCNSQSSREFHARQASSDAIRRKLRLSSFSSRGGGIARGTGGRGFALELGPRKSAPRPVHLRPTSRPTAAEATAARRAINLRRSVLGAIGRLRVVSTARQVDVETAKHAICDFSFTTRTQLRRVAHALPKQDQGFAEPGALSSTSPTDLPLPRTALRESFVLVASRARRSGNLRLCRPSGARGSDDGNPANCDEWRADERQACGGDRGRQGDRARDRRFAWRGTETP